MGGAPPLPLRRAGQLLRPFLSRPGGAPSPPSPAGGAPSRPRSPPVDLAAGAASSLPRSAAGQIRAARGEGAPEGARSGRWPRIEGRGPCGGTPLPLPYPYPADPAAPTLPSPDPAAVGLGGWSASAALTRQDSSSTFTTAGDRYPYYSELGSVANGVMMVDADNFWNVVDNFWVLAVVATVAAGGGGAGGGGGRWWRSWRWWWRRRLTHPSTPINVARLVYQLTGDVRDDRQG
uniref:Uncharacterized protein n=1 Tax=Setaria viridis TaxID=4556 RepID=A0A4V6D1G2_SETVI|nr:LOW QUALITY PROTEIN: hypothetical protein SEVIR_9G304400v2 [Setaria viridis]